MTDYSKALEEGFAAARKAEASRKEIEKALAKFKNDLLAASGGRLLVEVRQFEEEIDAYARLLGQEPAKYEALTASNPLVAKKSYSEIARWTRAIDGYPCILTYNNEERQCEDLSALEQGLADLLRDPTIGERLYIIVNQKL